MTSSIQLLRRRRLKENRVKKNQARNRTWVMLFIGLPLLIIFLLAGLLVGVTLNGIVQLSQRLPAPTTIEEDTLRRMSQPGPRLYAPVEPNDLQTPDFDDSEAWIEIKTTYQTEPVTEWITLEELPRDVQQAGIVGIDPLYWSRESVGWLPLFLGAPGDQALELDSPVVQYLIENDPLLADFSDGMQQGDIALLSPGINRLIGLKLLSDRYSDRFLAEWYLNRAYYGDLRFGLEEASRYYFGSPAAQLDLPRGAMLARIPLQPAINPFDDPDSAKLNQERVLETLLRQNVIQQDQFIAARFTPLASNSPRLIESEPPSASEYAAAVVTAAATRVGPESTRFNTLQIYTPLDLTLQFDTLCVIEQQLSYLEGAVLPQTETQGCELSPWLVAPSNASIGQNQQIDSAAAVIIDPRSGYVLAQTSNRPAAALTQEKVHQPGPALMPITALAAFSQRVTLGNMLLDISYDIGTPFNGTPFAPTNRDDRYLGPISLREAILRQSQPGLAELLTLIGPGTMLEVAQELGLSINDIELSTTTPLEIHAGGGTVSLEEMTFAYGVFANGGIAAGSDTDNPLRDIGIDPVYILGIVDDTNSAEAETVYLHQAVEQPVTTAPLAYLVTDILQDDGQRCSDSCPPPLGLNDGRPVARYYGESADYRDSWALGFTPQRVVGVWAGNEDGSPSQPIPAAESALPIWHALMEQELDDLPITVRPRPDQISEQVICYPSGLLPTDICPKVTELFIAETTPTRFDDMVQEFLINQETGLLATPDTPLDLIDTERFVIYPAEALEWVEANNIPQPPSEYDTLRNRRPVDGVELVGPEPFETIDQPFEIEINVTSSDYERLRVAWYPRFSANEIVILEESVPVRLGERQIVGRVDPDRLDEGLVTLLLTFFRADDSIAEIAVPLTIAPNE